ncbi:MAG: porin [Desulfohalobiaceae bacterium]
MKVYVFIAAAAIFAALSFNVHAATIYEKEGTKLELKGDYQIQLRQEIGEDEDPYLDYDDLTVSFKGSQELMRGWSAFGELKMDWKDQVHGDAEDYDAVDEAYAGLKYHDLNFGSVAASMGKQDWGSDDFPVEESVEMDGGDAFPAASGKETFKVNLDAGMFQAVGSYDLEENSDSGDDNDSAGELYVTTDLQGLKLGAIAQTYKENEDADSVETYGARIGYDFDVVYLAADYTTREGDDEHYQDVEHTNAVAVIPVQERTKLAVGYGHESPDEGEDVNSWYANVNYSLSSNVKIFAEVGDNDKDNTDMGYLAGMQFKF